MTIKEIANLLTHKSTKTILTWIRNNGHNLTIIEKLDIAYKTKKPADFTLNETVEILKAGKVSESLISILIENAEKVSIQNQIALFKDEMKSFAKEIVTETIRSILPLLNQKQQLLQIKQDYFSILGYANTKGLKLEFSQAMSLGKEASKLSKETDKEVRRIPDERFGTVGSYHISVLEKVFEI